MQKRWGARAFVNRAIGLCNFYALGSPAGRLDVVFPGGDQLSSIQMDMVEQFLKDSEEWCANSGGEIIAKGRGTARLFQMIQSLEHQYGPGPRTEREIRTVTVAEAVDVKKASMPPQAGLLRAADLMCPERAAVFRDLNCILLDSERIPAVATRACHMVDQAEEEEFARKLLGNGMAILLPECDVARHPVTGKLLLGGFFGVPHREGKQRLIFDRRPMNELEDDLSPSWLQLPHGCQFAEMQLARGDGVRGSTDELACWFYQLAHESGWWPRQAVGRRLDRKDFQEFGGIPGRHYRACLTVVAMGDRNGVPFAQETHEFMLRAAGLLKADVTLRFGQSVPRGPLWEGAYVDDHIFALQLPLDRMSCTPGHSPSCVHCTADGGQLSDVAGVEKLASTYAAHGAERSVEKERRFETNFVAWGTTVEGRRGRVSVDIAKRQKIARLAFSLALYGSATKAVLRSMVGSLVHPFMHRRCLMSILSSTFHFIENMSPTQECALPADVVDELLMSFLWLPFAYTNIRAETCTTVSATDATNVRGGACRALIPGQLARSLFRRGEQRGEHGKLRWSDLEVEMLPTLMRPPSADVDALVEALPWVAPRIIDLPRVLHINIQELRALVDEVEIRIREGLRSARMVVFVDSRVVVGAVAKGRSSARELNKHLRRLAAFSVGADVSVRLIWVGTASNPADAPSRLVALPKRSPMPSWAAPFWKPDVATAVPRPLPQNAEPGPTAKLPPVIRQRERPSAGVSVPFAERRVWPQATCREYYSGCGRLSSALRAQGFDTVEFEAVTDGVLDSEKDMGCSQVVDREIVDIEAGRVCFAHLGIVCSSWCNMTMVFNGGTRTQAAPYGTLKLQREIIGNRQVQQVKRLIDALIRNNIPFTLENPHDSYIWHSPELLEIAAHPQAQVARFDQCMYKLRPPDYDGSSDVRVRKRTRLLGTLAQLPTLFSFV